MTINTTKDKIVFEALKLFSRDGFEASSTRAIARSINCSDAVIYKHFKSKQEILDAIVDFCSNRLIEKSSQIKLESMCWKEVEKICLDMFEFQTTDPWIVPFRKLLVIEQFKNEKLGKIYREVFITKPLSYMEDMFKTLIEQGYMKQGNPKVYAMDLYSPFFMYHTIGGEEKELLKNLEEHVTLFRKNVVTDEVYLEQ
ncbi:MAG: TetR/AcrR family transcriptional regulator [Agathobacter sp.]|nr:TetR/AcrR family transcriptional regulator [Agathobacter sp.]